MSIIIMLAGLYTIWGALTKPNHFWAHRKAMFFRNILGDTITTFIYLGIGFFVLFAGIYAFIKYGLSFNF